VVGPEPADGIDVDAPGVDLISGTLRSVDILCEQSSLKVIFGVVCLGNRLVEVTHADDRDERPEHLLLRSGHVGRDT